MEKSVLLPHEAVAERAGIFIGWSFALTKLAERLREGRIVEREKAESIISPLRAIEAIYKHGHGSNKGRSKVSSAALDDIRAPLLLACLKRTIEGCTIVDVRVFQRDLRVLLRNPQSVERSRRESIVSLIEQLAEDAVTRAQNLREHTPDDE